ncbi:2Fe-2S iron-sulfur cluster-binding protein [Streptomyces sp. TLI_105]|uniref:2Fe-2S iron-sulfur cluster-binding protein n=1 Tax=Streptomyces sp. TLI_105 TaxID=1881019 RepID=UPI00089D6CFA|nr:2Fe-2S iron-sulfur cluster-binding protein [Streptomyces sp. TLI_105]SEB89991.1 2Fe-2S iron-sulfur cluster binding domain-containing protein [Streptomyces sp. TLI_105]
MVSAFSAARQAEDAEKAAQRKAAPSAPRPAPAQPDAPVPGCRGIEVTDTTVCLPPGVRLALTALGRDPDRLRSERLTSAAAPTERVAGTVQDVVVVDRGVKPSLTAGPTESVLDAGLKAGLDLPYSCKEGACGTCRATTVCGRVAPGDCELDPREIADGSALTYRTRPGTATVSPTLGRRQETPLTDHRTDEPVIDETPARGSARVHCPSRATR